MRTIINAIDLPALRARLASPDEALRAALLELLGSERYGPAVDALLAGERGRDDTAELLDAVVGVLGYRPLSVDLPTEQLEQLAAAAPALAALCANRGPDGAGLDGPMRVAFLGRDQLPVLRAACAGLVEGADEERAELLRDDLLPALDAALADGADLYMRSM